MPSGGISPSGSDIELGPDEELGQGLKGGFIYGVGMDSIYDSNFFLSENNPENEWTNNFYALVNYTSDPEGGAPFSILANYNPNFQSYFNNPEFNGLDQSADVSFNFQGSRTTLQAFANLAQSSGTDQIIGEFVTQSIFSWGLAGTYQVAPRTAVTADFSSATSVFEESSLEGSDIYTTSVSGAWSATEYLNVGPVIQYNVAISDNSGTREAWQLLMQAGYRVGERIQLGGSIGVDYSTDSRESDSSTVGLTGNFNGNYVINERLSWSGSVIYVTVPSPNEVDNVVNNLTFQTGLTRKFLRATGSAGLVVNLASYEGVGPVSVPLEDENNVNAYFTYSRPFFHERVNVYSTLFYAVNSGQSEWTQLQLSLGMNLNF